MIIFAVVDFPDPDSPTNASVSPRRTVKVRSSTAVLRARPPSPNSLQTLVSSMTSSASDRGMAGVGVPRRRIRCAVYSVRGAATIDSAAASSTTAPSRITTIRDA